MVTQNLQEGPRWFDSISVGSYLGSLMGIPGITLSGTAVLSKVAQIQVGTVGSRTGSDASVTFYATFTGSPQVFVQNISMVAPGVQTTNPVVILGSTGPSSFYALATGSPINFNWIAIGPI